MSSGDDALQRTCNTADFGLRKSGCARLEATGELPIPARTPNSRPASHHAVSRARAWLTAILRDTTGATAIEYGLVSVLVAVGGYTMLFDTGDQAAQAFHSIDTVLRQSNEPPPPAPFTIPPPPFGWPGWNPPVPGTGPAPVPESGPGMGPTTGPGMAPRPAAPSSTLDLPGPIA